MSSAERSRPLLIEMDIKVRTYDIDSAGHVSNISYLYWMEDMRLDLIERYFSMEEFLAQGYQPVVAATKIEYKRAIKLFDKPKGTMWVAEHGRSSYTFEGEVHVDGVLTTHAKFVGVFVDPVSGKPKRLPKEFTDIFKEAGKNQSDASKKV